MGAENSTPLKGLLRAYAERTGWGDIEQALEFTEIRNFLAHRHAGPGRFAATPTWETVRRIERAAGDCQSPKLAVPTFAREVTTVDTDSTLSDVLKQIAVSDFSQFPVYRRTEFAGLLTENGITRWIAGRARDAQVTLDTSAVSVRQLLRQETTQRAVTFMRTDAEVGEVVVAFRKNPLLEAVLFTNDGARNRPLLGIATQWDVIAHR
jgi:predicted transcriptional regulator